MKDSFDEEFNSFKTLELGQANLKLKEALNDVNSKENEIQAISNDLKIAENKITDVQRQLDEAKNKENEANLKLANTLSTVDDKNMEIQSLNAQIASQNEEILDLKNNLVNKDNLVALQRELDSRDVTIREKDVQIQLLNDNQSHDGVVNKTSVEDRELLELNDIKRELELAKENKLKIRAVGDEELENVANLIDSQSNDGGVSLNQNEEVERLKAEIDGYKSTVEELEKFKFVYDKLTAPQLKNLNSIQSQIYHLLPEDEAMDTLSVKDYLNDLAFKNLSFGNTKNILKSLERKGYVEVAKKENDIFFWQKLPLPEE